MSDHTIALLKICILGLLAGLFIGQLIRIPL